MTNMEKLRELYREKEAAGLVHVGFTFSEAAGSATAEELAGEILEFEEAIRSGKSTPLDFGDRTLTDEQMVSIKRHMEATRGAPPVEIDAKSQAMIFDAWSAASAVDLVALRLR